MVGKCAAKSEQCILVFGFCLENVVFQFSEFVPGDKRMKQIFALDLHRN